MLVTILFGCNLMTEILSPMEPNRESDCKIHVARLIHNVGSSSSYVSSLDLVQRENQ